MAKKEADKEPDTATEDGDDDELDRVRAWRVLQAAALGFEWADAVRIADEGVDHHRLAELIEQGASPELALRILA